MFVDSVLLVIWVVAVGGWFVVGGGICWLGVRLAVLGYLAYNVNYHIAYRCFSYYTFLSGGHQVLGLPSWFTAGLQFHKITGTFRNIAGEFHELA